MPTIRYQIRNEYGLSDPDLYRAADKDDPEAVLEGVAMAGLVGVLRQIGDLAGFAVGIFHNLHEEVTATAARGHGLMLRVQQLEAEFPSIEKAFLVQTNHLHFAYDEGLDWRGNLRINQNLITQGDMPRFILDSYEECRGPPRLFMLDKFDVAGAGACLKRYSDPSFFKVEFASSGVMEEEVQIEKKAHRIWKRASRWRNDDTTESFLAPLVNSNLQQERDDKVSARVPNRRVKLKSRNLHELDIANRRSYMERLLEVHSLEQMVWPENSISHSPVDVKPIESSGLTSEVQETVIDTITDSTTIRQAYPTQSPIRKEVTCIPRNELDGRHVKSMRKLKFVPKEKIMTESEIRAKVCDDGYVPCKADGRSPLLQDVELRKSFTDGEFTIKCGPDGDMSHGYSSDEAEKNPATESLGYAEFNPVAEYEDYRSDNVSSDLENYVDALNTIGSEFEMDSESRVKSDPVFFNMVDRTIDSGIYEHQQVVPEKPLEPDSVEKSTSIRERVSILEHSTPNSVILGDLIDTQQPLQDENWDNFHKEIPNRTPDEIGNGEVRGCALLPIITSDAQESYITSIMSEVRETSPESLAMDLMCRPARDDTGSNYAGHTLVDAKESDVTSIMSEVRETLAESLVMDLMCSPLQDDTVSNHVGSTLVVSQQLEYKAEGLPNFSNNRDDFSHETIPLSEVGNVSFSGRYMPEGIDPAECIRVQTSTFDMSGHHSKDHGASEENTAQHIEESTLTLTSNAEEQQESVKEAGACFDGDVLPNITEASPENGASILHPAVLAEEILSKKNSHEVTRDLDGVLPHADMEFTDPITNSRILSDNLLPLSDIQHTEDVGSVSFKDTEDAQGETIPHEAHIGHVEDLRPLSSLQLGASRDPMEQDNKDSSCEIMSPSNSALSLENNHVTKQPDVFAMGMENTVIRDEDNAEVMDERETLLPDIVPAELEYLYDVDDSHKFNGVHSEELLTLSSEKEALLDDMQLQLNSSAEEVGESNIVMPNVEPLKLGHFSDVEEPESCNAGLRDKVPLDSASVMSSDDMQLQDAESEWMANSNSDKFKDSSLPELGHFSDVEEPESCNADSRDKVPVDSASVMSSADKQLQDEESECMANSYVEESKESPLAASVEHLILDSVNVTYLDDKQFSNKENDHMAASNAGGPKESSSAESREHFPLDSVDEMFPDDIQVQNKELHGMEMDGTKSAADTMGLPRGSDLQKESLQLEKQIDDDALDEYVIVEANDNYQGTCSVYPNSGKTFGFNVQLQENYLPTDAALHHHGMEVKDLSDQDILALPSLFESQPKISTEISSSILQIQHLSDDSNPSDAKLLDNVYCTLSCEDSKPNIDKEDLLYCSSENEDYGPKEGISPSTHSLVERTTSPGDDSELNVVFLHQEGAELEDSDMQFQRPCANDNKSISRDIEDGPPQSEPCIFYSKGGSYELNTSLCNVDMTENVDCEASVASRRSSEILPIACASQAVSETRLQEALETWLDEPTSSFQLPDVDETPPLPPLEWRQGNLRLASLTSSGDTIQPPVVTNPFVEQTAGEEKYPQGPLKVAVEMFQTEKPSASLPVVENERDQHESSISEEEIVQSSRSSEFPLIADEERKHKSLSLEAEMTNPSSALQLSPGEDGKFTTGQGEWQHEQRKRPPLARLIPSLELERSQHEALSVAIDPLLPLNPFVIGPSIEEWNHRYGYGVYGGGSMQQLNLPPPLEARGLNMPPYGFLYSMGENPSTVYNFTIPTADGDKPSWRYRSIRDRPRDPLIEAVAAHDKSKLRKVTEQDRSSVKQKTDEKDSLLEQIRNKSFSLKPANATKANIKGVPPTNLKVAAILEKANAIRQACAGSDEDDDDVHSWSDS